MKDLRLSSPPPPPTHSKVRGVYFIDHVCVAIGPCVWVLSGWLSSESVNLSLTKLAVFYLDDYLLNQSTSLWPNLLWHSIILSQNMMCKNVMCKNVMCKNVLIFKVKCVLFYWLCGWNCTLKRIQNNCQTNSTWVEHYFSYFYCQAFSEWNILSAAFTVRPILPG